MDTKDKIIKWFISGNTGVSSEAIVAQLMNIKLTQSRRGDHPHDGGDFGRCYKLLEAVPEFKLRINEMATRSNEWAALVTHWNVLTILYENDGDVYDEIRGILKNVKDKSGIEFGGGITFYA